MDQTEGNRTRVTEMIILSGNSVDEAGGSDVSWLTDLWSCLDTGVEPKELRQL